MLEKAMISGVTHTLEEAVYEVKDADRADLFGALADAAVNVDTIVETSREIVFSAPTEDRTETTAALERLGAQWSAREGLGKVSLIGAGMKSHRGSPRGRSRRCASSASSPSSWPPRPSRSPSTFPKGRSSARSRRCTRRSSSPRQARSDSTRDEDRRHRRNRRGRHGGARALGRARVRQRSRVRVLPLGGPDGALRRA